MQILQVDFFDQLTPLYKILCFALLFLLPLLPAYLLFKIAPGDRILATGNFNGIKINATGAIAVYVVLLVALYPKFDGVIKSIDDGNISDLKGDIRDLKHRNALLLDQMPWKINCNINLFNNYSTKLSNTQLYDCFNPDSVYINPIPLRPDAQKNMISFYLDDDILKSNQNILRIIFKHGTFGSPNIPIPQEEIERNRRLFKSVTLVTSCYQAPNTTTYAAPSINIGTAALPQMPQ